MKPCCSVETMNRDAEPVSETLTGGDRDGRDPPEIQPALTFRSMRSQRIQPDWNVFYRAKCLLGFPDDAEFVHEFVEGGAADTELRRRRGDFSRVFAKNPLDHIAFEGFACLFECAGG